MPKRPAKREEFFEAVPGTASTPMPTSSEAWGWQRWVSAGWSDGRRLTWLLVSRMASRRARRWYAAGALFGFGLLATAGALIAATTFNHFASDLASPATILAKKQTGTTILDKNGQVLYQAYGAKPDTLLKLGSVPKSLQQATLAAEDANFYNEPAISWRGTARAVWVDATHMGKVEGGSTITQQLVKNSLLTQNKSFTRKYQELLLSLAVEHRYPKDQILAMYLSEIYYGEGAYGAQAAAETYFHKPLSQLDLSQSALLAGIPVAPSNFDPVLHPDNAKQRRDQIIDRMAALGWIKPAQANQAKAQPVQAFPQQVTIKAPHFVFYVLDQLKQRFGEDQVVNGGLTVTTTLDYHKQQIAEQAIKTQIAKMAGHNMTNGALISLDPKTGAILAMVGSVDYYQPQFGSYNVTLANRQPGSSIKPVGYVTAFEKGWTGATHVEDTPLSVPNGDGTNFAPQDADGRFRGTVTVRSALAMSLNLPAVRMLQFIGLQSFADTAQSLGITTLTDPQKYGLAVVLGGAEVKPIEMAAAYGAFANGGHLVEPYAIQKVTDRYGHQIAGPPETKQKQVLDPRYVYMITSILSDNNARAPEFGPRSPLYLADRPAAAKTGTTNDYRDNWTIGYTPSLVTAVWTGNNDNTPMVNVLGIDGAAPVWHDYMEQALAGTPVEQFNAPAGVVTDHITSQGCQVTSGGTPEVFLTDHQPPMCRAAAPAPSAQATPPEEGNQPPNPSPGGDAGQGGVSSPTPTPVSPAPTPTENPFIPPGRH